MLMHNKLQLLHRKTQSVFFFKFIMIHLLSRHHPAANPSRPSLFVRLLDREEGAGRGWRKFSCRMFFKMASLRLPLPPLMPQSREHAGDQSAPSVGTAAPVKVAGMNEEKTLCRD